MSKHVPPHPDLLPQGEGTACRASGRSDAHLANPAEDSAKARERFSLSPRERAGVRGNEASKAVSSESTSTRGAASNPANRFEQIHLERDEDWNPEEDALPTTKFFHDRTQKILSSNDSPDIGFTYSLNPYRGCEHGCIYCYARPFHEYLGFSSGLDFETRILVKEDAPELLRRELTSPRWQPKLLALCGVTDAYQPIERTLQITRRCLPVLAEFRNPVGVITKNHLVTRDRDILCGLAGFDAAAVFLSITTLDRELARVLEPRASQPEGRLAALRELSQAGIPVGVMVAPTIPGLTDHEMPAILQAARDAGARFAGYVLLRLPHDECLERG